MNLRPDQLEVIRNLLNDRIHETVEDIESCDLEGKIEVCRQVVELDEILIEINREMGL